MLIRTPSKGLFLSVHVNDIKLVGKKQNIDPMWKVLKKEVELGEPTYVYLGCTQRQCEISKDIVDNYSTMFESRISAGAIEKLPCSDNLRVSSWSCDMEGHAKKCVARCCELANRTTQQLHKVSTPCVDDHHFKEEELKSVGELSTVCSQIILKCWYLARIGRPDIIWSVKNARSITKWTKACYKRLNRLISYIHHTCEYKQYCHVGNTAKQCRLELFQDFDFAGDLENSKSTSGGALGVWEVIHLLQSVGCVRNKLQFRIVQQNRKSSLWMQDWGWMVSPHWIYGIWSSQFLVTRIRVNKKGETRLWTNVKFVQHFNTIQKRKQTQGVTNDLDNVDFILSNVNSSHQEALLYVFEDNEAVIKMIIKGRSPTMRHVSRTHRVALDWLFDRINLGFENPNQVHWHQKPTCRHTDQGKFHTWWIESSFVFV